jgi:hypothetical protein
MTCDALIAHRPTLVLCFGSAFAAVVTQNKVTLEYDSSSELENVH